MRRFLSWVGLVAILLTVTVASGDVAVAQGNGDEVTREQIDAADPLVAFGELGFTDDEQRYFRVISQDVVDPQEYQFADQVENNPPTLDLPGTRLMSVGAAIVRLPGDDLPFETTVNGGVFVPSGDPQLRDRDVALMWAVYDRPYSMEGMESFLNRGFVVPGNDQLGIPAWQSSFPGDTWNGGFRMPTITYGPEPWNFVVFEYVPPQQFEPRDMDGFALLHGDTLIVAVDADQLLNDAGWGSPPDEFRFGYHGHDHDGRFGAVADSQSFITITPNLPRTYEDFALASPTLLRAGPEAFPIIEPTPAPTTSSTAAPATTGVAPTTSGASAPATTSGGQGPPTTQAESGGKDGSSPLVWLLPLGLVVIVVGGYVIYTNSRKKDEVIAKLADCTKEEAAWRAAVKRYNEVCEDLLRARREFAVSKQNLADAKKRRDALAEALGSSVGSSGVDYHHLPEGGTVTRDGLNEMIQTAEAAVTSYESRVQADQESADRWQGHMNDAATAEADARRAYEACIGATVAAPAPCEEDVADEDTDDEPRDVPVDPEPGSDPGQSAGGESGEPERGTDEGGPTDGGDGPEEPTDPEAPGGTPPPVTPGDEDDPTPACDWAFYVVDGGGRRAIRPAARGHHECCVYEMKVVSTFSTNFADGRIRQDLDRDTGALPNERDRSLAGDGTPTGLSATFLAGVRTWPAGQLGVMHGRGDMSEWPSVGATEGPWPDLPLNFPGSERPDALVDYAFDDSTAVTVEFTDGCEGSGNTYRYSAEAALELVTTVECTNENHDPVCPVELPTDGNASVDGSGDVGYATAAALGTIGDDVDSAGETLGSGESHDHVFADKNTKLERPTTSDSGTKTKDDWESTHASRARAFAAVIVPPSVSPTTDRVTAAMSGSFRHELDLNGSATPGHGPGNACAGHGACKCAPNFRLQLEGGNGTLWVDGEQYTVNRPDAANPEFGDTVDRWDVAGGQLPGPI